MEMSRRRSATQDWNSMVMNNKHRRHFANIVGTDIAGTDIAGTDIAGTDIAGTDIAVAHKTKHMSHGAIVEHGGSVLGNRICE